uniref:Cation-transporting P-type ATPase N-terminal domain-containing protein n=1 Tax=Plectus sambesii TaxID=2011161 RepID=A0A914UYP3_9BILA
MNDAKKWFRRRLGLGEERNLAASEAVQGIELEGERSVADRDLSSSFTEHHLDRHELTELFLLSNINASQPTASQGLSAEEAQRCLERDGRNALTPPVEISDWQLLLRQFLNMFWLLLIAAGILSLITYFLDTTVPLNLYVAIILFVMVIVMCLISFYEEKKAKEVVHGFQSLMPTSCSVIRDGRKRVISAEELVVGDLVFIRNGCRVAADVRLLHCSGVKLETSSITGEAEPIEFTSDPAAEEVSVFESHNVAFNGSFCVDGEGLGVVIRVADKTIIGQIASLTTSQEEKKSSLEKQVEKFVRFITILALVMATIVFFIGAAVSNFRNLLSTFINGFLVVIVANVPQGLPATLTSQLTIIARRMAKKNVFLKKLDVIEAFGAATVIASDKTGTLTKNIMTVTDLWYNKQYMTGRPDIKQRTIMAKQHVTNVLELYESPLPEMLAVMTVCNKAQIDMTVTRVPMRQSVRGNMAQILWSPSAKDQDPERGAIRRQSTRKSGRYFQGQMSQETAKRKNISGNPSEVALLRYASQMTDVHDMRRCFDVVFEIPFNSVRKWHLLIARRTDKFAKDGMATFTLMMKGAPEKLIDLCTTIASESGEVELTEDEKMDFQDAYLHFGNEGRRVIGFASKTFVAAEDTNFSQEAGNYPQGKYSFLGMAAIMDPPRDDTAKAIQECRLAGIKVFMVTGDHPTTAAAIARQIGLIGQSETVERQGREKIQMSVVEQHDSDYAI